jgi:hypothetical protein
MIKINMADRDIARLRGVAPALVAQERAQREAEAHDPFDAVAFEPGSGVVEAPAPAFAWPSDEGLAAYPPLASHAPDPERLTTLAAVHALAEQLWREHNPAGRVVVDRIQREKFFAANGIASADGTGPATFVKFELGVGSADTMLPLEPTAEEVATGVGQAWAIVSDQVARRWRP